MSDVTSDVIDIIAKKKRVDKPNVELSDRLEDLGLELLDAVEMIFDLEEKFDITIPYNANTNNPRTEFDTVGDVVKCDREIWSIRSRERREPRRRHRARAPSRRSATTPPPIGTISSSGVSGLGPITLSPMPEELTQKVAGEVKDFDPLKHFEERQISTLDRVSQFAVVAAREAIAQSGLVFDMPLSVRTACIIGTGVGGQTTHDDSFRRSIARKDARVSAHHPETDGECAGEPDLHAMRLARPGLRGGERLRLGDACDRASPSTWCARARSIAPSPAAPRPASRSERCAAGKRCG